MYTLWNSLRCRPATRINVNPIGKHFVAACILTNCRTCIRGGNQISKYFDCAPPSIAEYLDYPKPPENRLRRFMNASVRMLARYGVRAN